MTTYQSTIEKMRQAGTQETARSVARRAKERGVASSIKDLMTEWARQEQIRERRLCNATVTDPLTVPITNRLRRHLTKSAAHVQLGYGLTYRALILRDRDIKQRLWLVGNDGWYEYSRRAGTWRYSVAVLCGIDDGQTFAFRVPGSCDTVEQAIDAITPAAVRKAQTSGRWVARQGDVYLVELCRGQDNLTDLPYSHTWDSETRTLRHQEHVSVAVPDHVRAVRVYRQIDRVTNRPLD